MATPPSAYILESFGLEVDTSLVPLAGGLEQTAWRARDIVLKPVQAANPHEGEWVAAVLDVIVEDGFRVIRPVRTVNGDWLVDGWTAWHWLEGAQERRRWTDVGGAADALHRALPAAITRAGVEHRPAWLETRGHRWGYAEATVWHGAAKPATVNVGALEASLYERAVAVGPPLDDDGLLRAQVIHGDVASNVLRLADGSGLALIDFSPGWRTAESVSAQIVVEAVTWFGAPADLLNACAQADLARACAFRLLCALQASVDWATDLPGEREAWSRTLDLIGA